MSNIAIIPARGGSKRIPKKNIRAFHGKPIIAYSITAALESKLFDRVIVSTDDEEIASIAREFGADVPFVRTPLLSDDLTGTNAVVADALRRVNGNYVFACCIYATAPLITATTLKAGFEAMSSPRSSVDFAVTVTTFPFPIQRACQLNDESLLEMREPSHRMTRSQDLDELYHDAGQVYWGRTGAFLSDVPIFAGNTAAVRLPRFLVQDIDTLEDWARAEAMYAALKTLGRT